MVKAYLLRVDHAGHLTLSRDYNVELSREIRCGITVLALQPYSVVFHASLPHSTKIYLALHSAFAVCRCPIALLFAIALVIVLE